MATVGGGHVTTMDITPDVTQEGPKPVEATPEQTETADYVQLAQEEGAPAVEGSKGPAQPDPTP
jgi:hypothetical protein